MNEHSQKALFSQTEAIWHSFFSRHDPWSWFMLQFWGVMW